MTGRQISRSDVQAGCGSMNGQKGGIPGGSGEGSGGIGKYGCAVGEEEEGGGDGGGGEGLVV